MASDICELDTMATVRVVPELPAPNTDSAPPPQADNPSPAPRAPAPIRKSRRVSPREAMVFDRRLMAHPLSPRHRCLGPRLQPGLIRVKEMCSDRPRGTLCCVVQRSRPTMRDVAARAAVSLKTVSRVVNGEPTVGDDLVARVRQAAADLDYRPNLAANLRGRRARPSIIGLLIQDVSNEFSASIFRAVEDVAGAHGVQVLASNLDEQAEREQALVASLVARRVNGLVVVPPSCDHRYLQLEQAFGTPIVFLDRPPVRLPADSVVSDNRAGAAAGVAHLLQAGHRRIGFLGETPAHRPARLRYAGYLDALAACGTRGAAGTAGAGPDPGLVRRGLDTEAAATAATLELLEAEEPPTALFAAHNRLTIGAVRGLRALGLEHRIALVGFDDFTLADLLDPPVTVVAQDPATMGRLGAELLFRRIRGWGGRPQRRIVPTRLVPRGSGEISP